MNSRMARSSWMMLVWEPRLMARWVSSANQRSTWFSQETPMTLADDCAGFHVECGEQRGGAIAKIVRGAALSLAGPHRQNRLHAIERLNLRLLVRAQHQRPVRRVEIEPHNIAHLLH